MGERSARLPRLASASLGAAIVSHIVAVVTGLGQQHHVAAWQWAVLAAAEMMLLLVMFERPDWFYVRSFRLPGAAVSALSVMVLLPLPAAVRLYRLFVPQQMVVSIALGIAVFAVVFWVAPFPASDGLQREFGLERRVPVAILAIALLLLPLWLRSLSSVPIFELLSGRAKGVDIALERQGALSGLGATPLRLAVGALRNLYLMFAVGWLVADLAVTPLSSWRERSRKRIYASLALGVASVFALVTTERAILGQVGIVAIVAVLVARRKTLSARLFLGMGGIGVAFPLLFGFLMTGDGFAAYETVRRRVLYLPTDVLINYFISFPRRHDFLHGASLPKVQRLFGGETFNLSGYIYEVAYSFDDRFTGNANGSFIGVGWANFGLLGVVLWFGATALALVFVERRLAVAPRRAAAALRGVAAVQAVLLTSADVTRTLLNFAPGFLDLVLFVAIAGWWSRRTEVAMSAGRAEGEQPRPLATPRGR